MGIIKEDFNNLRFKKSLRIKTPNGVCEVEKFFREGGMAQIFLGKFNGLQSVIKTPKHSSDADMTQDKMDFEIENRYIEREAKALSKLRHPGIVKLFDYGTYKGENYLVEEFLEGDILTDKCMDNPFPEKEASRLIIKIGEVIKYMHENSFLHRDLSPNNIMINNDLQIKLFDLGLAIDDFNYGNKDLIRKQTRIGTDFFSAREQCNEGIATAQGDIYSLGVVFNYLLTGVWPTGYGPYSPHIDFDGVSDVTGRIIFKATQEEMDNRYQTVDDFIRAVIEEEVYPPMSGAFINVSGASYPITKIRTIIGREVENSEAHINVKDPKRHIARCISSINLDEIGHCEIIWDYENDKYYLKDLDSINRTWVLSDRSQNIWKQLGRDLSSRIIMNDGDLFTFAYDKVKGHYITFTFKNYGGK